MSNKMALDALTAIQDAIGMPTSGDSSDFVWPKSTMRHPGETAYGWICEKHGLGYQSGCICCAGDLKAYREQKDREARYAREDAIRDASKKVRAAIAALQAEPQGWMPIESAPKDGTHIILSNGATVAEGWWEYQEPYIREKRDIDGRYIDQEESDGFDGWLDCQGGMQPDPTQWMPLPAAQPGAQEPAK